MTSPDPLRAAEGGTPPGGTDADPLPAGPSYRALALQTRATYVGAMDPAGARDSMLRSVERIRTQLGPSIRFIGPDVRLVVLPEYVLTGHPLGHGIDEWAELAAVDVDGRVHQELGAVARDLDVFLATNLYERDEHFPGLYFQSQVVHSPTGEVVLRYRRLNSVFTPTPHDVLDRYLEVHGEDALFPVADTEIGVLACIASEEILFPEVARCLAMRGAEVFLHATSEVASTDVTMKDVAKRARAQENLAWVVSANSAGIAGSPIPEASTDGGSQVVDHLGHVVVRAAGGESMVANAELDLSVSRRARNRPGMPNLHARNRFDLYAASYARAAGHPANGLGDGKVPDRSWFVTAMADTIGRLREDGQVR